MNMKKYFIIAVVLLMSSGCQNQSTSSPTDAVSAEAARYITQFEQELQSMDSLNSKAVSDLLAEAVAPKGQQQTSAVFSEKLQQAKRQIAAATLLLEEKEIPVQIPKGVREELLAARDDLLRTYRIKLKSLELLKEYQKQHQPYLLEQYRALATESANVMQEARSYITNARKLAQSR
jgi:hypothetical protein